MRRALAAMGILLVGWLAPGRGEAFDYLEHSYFTDYACHRVQRVLGERLVERPQDRALAARYLALGLFCPSEWRRPYCADGYKQVIGQVHPMAREDEGGEPSMTLGDYAALPDHYARFGPIHNLSRAGEDGLWAWTAEWMAREPGGVGGVVEDVAEDACETDGLPRWTIIAQDIDGWLDDALARGGPGRIPEELFSPIVRAPLPRGPSDPSGLYSFDNPHYLDLVLRNHNHFGSPAYGSWLGFHSAGVQIAGRRCEQTLGLEADALEDLGDEVEGFERVDFEALGEPERARVGCALLGALVRRRLRDWAERADPSLLEPVRPHLKLLLGAQDEEALTSMEAARLEDAVVAAVSSLIFEGSGLHFLQDGLAAGHMRTIRTRGGLKDARYDHGRDNAEGVVAVLRTRAGRFPFVAFGDTFMLGGPLPGPRRCELAGDSPRDPRHVSTCLLRHQRGLLTAVTMASLLDWALGGTLYGVATPAPMGGRPGPCEALDPIEGFICAHLPAQPTMVAGEEMSQSVYGGMMNHGSLPVPPPPYAYEALVTRVGFDVAGRAPQINISFSLLSELDDLAYWMTSYRVGVTASLGDGEEEQWFMDFAYRFHWRWAARFLIDAGASVHAGFKDFDRRATFFTGVSPNVGVTLLPEGWIKLPLALSISYRSPLTIFNSRDGFLGGQILEGQWLYLGFGLAFMN